MTSALRAHWGLDPDVRFLNHGSFGACPRAVLEAQTRLREELEREPVLFMGREVGGRLARVIEVLAPFVGADARDLVLVPNATTGVNAVLRSLAIEAGDEILITDHGYNACNNAARFVAERAGARVVVAQMPFPLSSSEEAVEGVLAAVSERTRIAIIDHVTSPTGLVLPVETLVARLRERGVEAIVDGAHGPGMLELNLETLGAAYYTGNCHKWLCTPKGAALLHVRRGLQESVRPLVISHGANAPLEDQSRFQVEFGWCGTDDPTAMLVIPEAIAFLESLFPGGWPELRAHNNALARQARDLLCAALEIEPPAPDDMLACLASVPFPPGEPGLTYGPLDSDPFQRLLFEEHKIEVPVMSWPAPPARVLRISAQAYNDLEEYRALAEVLSTVPIR